MSSELVAGKSFLVAAPRTGKTRPCISVFGSGKVLALTKLAAISGWQKELDAMGVTGWTIVNYEKVLSKNWDMTEVWDGLVADEAHVLSAYAKPSLTALAVSKIKVSGRRIGCTATPCAESHSQLFHIARALRLPLSSRYKNFYHWFKSYGIPDKVKVGGYYRTVYKRCRPQAKEEFRKLCCVVDRQKEVPTFVDASDRVVPLVDKDMLRLQTDMLQTGKIELSPHPVIAKTLVSSMQKAHQICGGTVLREVRRELVRVGGKVKVNKDGEPVTRGVNETLELSSYKARWVAEAMKDIKFACLTFFRGEVPLLHASLSDRKVTDDPELFQKTDENVVFVGSFQRFSRGVDLSEADAIVFYSIPFSAESFIQARERMLNHARTRPAPVYFPILSGGLDEQVYQRVAIEKMDFHKDYYING